jgi:hypothetical protein
MAIDPAKREAFRGLVQKMIDDGAPEDVIREATAKFKAKYDPAAGMGDLKMAESQAGPVPEYKKPLTLASAAFPGASKEYAPTRAPMPFAFPDPNTGRLPDYAYRTVSPREQSGLAAVGDALSLPTRAAGAVGAGMGYEGAAGGKRGSTGLARPVREWAGGMASSGIADMANQDPDALAQILRQHKGLLKTLIGAPAFVGASIVEDPTAAAGLAMAAPKAALGAMKAVTAPARAMKGAAASAYPAIGRSAEKLSGVPLSTLEAYADPAQRAAMKANFGKEQEIGQALVQKLNDKDLIFGEEIAAIDAATEKLPKISTKSAVKAMEDAKAKPDVTSRPATEFDISPLASQGNERVEPWINYVRGSKRPEDLTESARKAEQALGDARIDEAVKAVDAARESKLSDKAARIQLSTQSKAGKAGAEAAKTKKEFLDLSDKADKNALRWGGARNESGAIAEDALEKAQEAAKNARAAWVDAQGKYASGAISQADYSMAKATAEAAERHSVATDAARRIYNGESIAAVGSAIAEKHGIGGETLRALLTEARDRARSVPKDATELTAREYLNKRRGLDANIDFTDKADDVVNRVQKAGRTEMMTTLERVAEESGIPEFKAAMKSYSNKARIIEELERFIGRDKGTQTARIESFVNNLFGRNSQHKQELTKKFGELVNDETFKRAKAAQQAQEIGWDGNAAWFPMHSTGAMGAGQQWLGRLGFMLSSPKIASRVTLPVVKKIASAKTPAQAEAFIKQAMNSPDMSKAGKAVLASALMEKFTEGLPKNVIPFRQVADTEEDQVPTLEILVGNRRPQSDSLLSQLTRGR